MNVGNETGTRTQMFYGWRIVLAGFVVVALGLGAHGYMLGQVFPLVRDEFHGGAETFGWVLSLPNFASSFSWLVSGPFIDRFGTRGFILAGTVVAGSGLLGLSAVSSLQMLAVCSFLVGIGASTGFLLLPVQTAIANWFLRRRSVAMAIVSAAFVLANPLLGSLWSFVSGQFGWREAFLTIGLVMLVIGIPLALIIRHRPEDYGYFPDGKQPVANEDSGGVPKQERHVPENNFTLRETLRTRTFWLLSIAAGLGSAITLAIGGYTVPYLMARGYTFETIQPVSSLIPVVGLVGILVFGYLGDLYSKRHLLALAVAIQSASVLLLLTAGSILSVYLYLLVFGLGSGTIPLLLAIRADYFGRRAFALITVAMMLISGIVTMPLPALFIILGGWLNHAAGGYQLALLFSMLIGFIPAALFLFAKAPKQPKSIR